jgi:hypothetical protein
MVRNARRAEAEIAALKISYLKRIGKGSNIVIMDSSVHLFLKMNAVTFLSELLTCLILQKCRYSDSSKTVAKTLNSVGFKNCWVMSGGFSGRKGWAQSRLGTESYNLSVVEVVKPSRVIPAAADRFVTASSTSTTSRTTRKLLPGSVDG